MIAKTVSGTPFAIKRVNKIEQVAKRTQKETKMSAINNYFPGQQKKRDQRFNNKESAKQSIRVERNNLVMHYLSAFRTHGTLFSYSSCLRFMGTGFCREQRKDDRTSKLLVFYIVE